jgi:hypothetical protein
MKTLISIILLLAVVIAVPVNATDYYVSSIRSGRSDSNAGTSSNAPWATFDKVISMWGSLAAGDTVHVECGSQWDLSFSSDYFNITTGGSTTGGHITLRGDDYGTGNKPILRRTGGSGDCAFIAIKRSYVTVRDLELDGGYSNYGKNTGGMLIIADGSNLSNAQILNMRIRNLGGNSFAYICGIWLASWTSHTVSDCLIEGNEVSDYSAHGLNHYSSGQKINIIWRSNFVHNNYTGGRFPSANSALQICSGSSGCVFEHNWLEDTTTTEGGILAFGKYANDFGTNSIRFNVFANSSTYGILFTVDQSGYRLMYGIYGNILLNSTRSGIGLLPNNSYGSGTFFNIYNNTFYNNCRNSDSSRSDMEVDANSANTAVDFVSNLIFHRDYGGSLGLAVKSGFNGSFSHRNNLYWHEGGTDRNIISHDLAYTVANAKTYESTAQNTNPLFKNTAQPPTVVSYATGATPDGLSIQSTSPAIGNGADLGSTYALDINRAVRTAPWTIGAYQAGAAPSTDTTAPTVSITAPLGGAVVSGSAVTVSASASDNIGVAGVQFKMDAVNLGAEDTASPYSISWNTTGAANGSRSLTAVARDTAGNIATSAVVTVTVTNALPPADAIVSVIDTWQTRSFALQSGSFSAEFDAVPTTVNMDGIIGLSRGVPTDYENLAAIVRFNTNGQIDVRNGDIYAAAAQVSYAPGITCHFRMLVNVTSHTYSVYVQVGGNPEVRIADNYAFRTSQNAVTGLDTFAVTAVIGSHMVSGFSAAPVTSADTTAPTVSIVAPASGAVVSGSAVAVSASASDNTGVTGVQFKLDNANLGAENTVSPYSTVWNTTGATNGLHSLTAVARDAAGNMKTSAVISVTVSNAPPADTTAPTVSITDPVGGAVVSGSATTVSATASDNTGVAGVQFKLDGASLSAEDTTSPYSIVWNTTAATNGLHSLTAVARDAAGNMKTSAVISVTVSNAPLPEGTIVSDNTWKNLSFASQTNLFSAEFDAVPVSTNIDAITGLSRGNAADFENLAVTVRFNPSGQIDAQSGDVYKSDTPISYTAGTNYHFRLVVNVTSHVYSAYVKTGSDPETLIASNCVFRTGQNAVASLDNLAVTAVIGNHRVSGFVATPITVEPTIVIPEPPSGLRVVP